MSASIIQMLFPILLLNLLFNERITTVKAGAPVCQGVTRILENEGIIESPGFSKGETYPENAECKWLIVGPTGSTVTLQFDTFKLEDSKACDTYDYVTIKERCTGGALSSNMGYRSDGYCSTYKPPDINSTCNELHINFHSDDSDTDIGFHAKFKINKDSEAPQITWFGDSKKEGDLIATARDRFVFHCRVYGHPRPARYWARKDGKPLPRDAINDNNGTLTIPYLSQADSGVYLCVANNTWGEDRQIVSLTVRPKCMCPKNITTNWYHAPPFVVYDDDDTGNPQGIIPVLLEQMITACCQNCTPGHGVSEIHYGNPKHTINDVKDAIASNKLVHMSFPIPGKETDDEYKGEYYRPLFTSPGIAILVMSEDPSQSAQAMLTSVISAWPVLVLTIVMAWLSGIVMWLFDTWFNPEEFPRAFHKGVLEGFWWAYVTMTTVGYGDRSPKGYPARVFAIIWVLVGLVIISITTGVITTSLTAITLSTDLKLYGAKMGAMANTTEFRLGVLKNSRMTEFDDVKLMMSRLGDRSLQGVFLDSFVAGAHKNSYSSSIRVNKILAYDSFYGVVMRGAMGDRELQACFNNYVTSKKGQISTIVEDNTTPVQEPAESASEEIASGLFDANTPMFKNSVFACIGMLLFFSACGLIWDYGYMRHFRKNNSEFDDLALLAGPGYEDVKYNMELLDMLLQEVQEFNDTWTERFEATMKRHEDEYKEFSKTRAVGS